METPGARFWRCMAANEIQTRQTVLNDSGSEKKQPESKYNQTLQDYNYFRGIRDGSV